MTLERYRDLFARLRRAPGSMWTEDTHHRAPHKPLLLLAVTDLIARGCCLSHYFVKYRHLHAGVFDRELT